MRPIILKSIAPNLNPGTKANPERFGDVVRVRFPNSYRPCNFHCPYCVADLLHADERDRWEFRDQHRKILENLVASVVLCN